jgi:hypothetical protein
VRYFKGYMEGYFKKDSDDRRVFFPWGSFGRGYTLTDREIEPKLLKSISMYSIVVGLCFGANGIFLGVRIETEMDLFAPLVLLALFVPLSLILYGYLIRRLLKDTNKSEEKMIFQESLQNISLAVSTRGLYFWLFFSAALILMNLYIIFELDGGLMETSLALFFASNVLILLHFLRLKKISKTSE